MTRLVYVFVPAGAFMQEEIRVERRENGRSESE